MHFFHLTIGVLAVGFAYGNPVAVQDSKEIAALNSLSVYDERDAASNSLSVYQERDTFNWKDFQSGAVRVFCAAYFVGEDTWVRAINTCQEFRNGNNQVATGVGCFYRLVEVLWKFSFWYRAFGGNYEAYLSTLPGHKRDAFDWHEHWHSLDQDQRSHLRAMLPSTPGFWLHSMSNGSPDISNSVALHFAADGASDPAWRQVTNGTHGFVHTMLPAANVKRAFSPDPSVSFGFDNVNGVKFSYFHPCRIDYADPNEDDLVLLANDFTQSFLAGGADKYAVEIDTNGEYAVYGTLIIEKDAFAPGYEPIDFWPPGGACGEL